MSVYFSYPSKDTTIYNNSSVNTGLNPITTLKYGEDKYSRYLIYFDFLELKNKINNDDILIDSIVTHKLKLVNTTNNVIKRRLTLDNDIDIDNTLHAKSFDIELCVITENWDEGTGFDAIYTEDSFDTSGESLYINGAANWLYRTSQDMWTQSGGTITTGITEQHFDHGNENLELDITDIVNTILTDTGYTYNGFCLKLTEPYELITGTSRTVSFFGLQTNSFFTPIIETVIDDKIVDDRNYFYLNKINRLFFYTKTNDQYVTLDNTPTCTIAGTPYAVTKHSKGIYYVDVFGDPNIFTDNTEYRDIWSNININNILFDDVSLRFVPKPYNEYYSFNSYPLEQKRYGVSLSGIKQDEYLISGDVRRVNVLVQKQYSKTIDVINNIYYKLYIKQGPNEHTIFDWIPVNLTNTGNYFTIDTSILQPQEYFIDLKLNINGETIIRNQILTFNIKTKIL
jgi:hypothetical protein